MAYTVAKTIHGRSYLYSVEGRRDSVTGKVRNRWTYLGRAPAGAAEVVPPVRTPRGETRRRLIEATERLLERGDRAAVTPSTIATEAGVAHGTFYRHFRDRSAAFAALVDHLRATRGTTDDELRDDVASASEARLALRAWIAGKLRVVRDRPEFIRGFYRLVASDMKVAAYRDERRAQSLSRLRDYLTLLLARGFITIADPGATAHLLYALYDGIYRQSAFDDTTIDDAIVNAACDLVERTIFT
jgi:AcrR family transcriptional regulator